MSGEERVLVVDDDAAVGMVLEGLLSQSGYPSKWVESGRQALSEIDDAPPALVITDLRMPGMSGFELLETLKERAPELPVVVITAFGSIEVAVDAMKRGAADFLTKPFERDEVLAVVARHLAVPVVEREPPPRARDNPESQSPVMQDCLQVIERAALTSATVLLRGASGTGKELAARTIHQKSGRSGAFVPVHCAALPDQLLESELFGFEKGAFTGATHRKPGRVELAEGGTLFLDEIGDISPSVQVKLLRLLQEKTYEPLGGTAPRSADVRFIAATHRDLADMVRAGTFREDLYYRLAVLPVHLPSLAERVEDIRGLARAFLDDYRPESPVAGLELTDEALVELERAPWPGNVRQLQNVVERLAVFAESSRIDAQAVRRELARDGVAQLHAPGESREDAPAEPQPEPPAFSNPPEVVGYDEELRRTRIEAMTKAYLRAGRNWSRAARLLGISRRTLYNWKREYDLHDVGDA